MSADDWRDADQADVTQAVHYALRFSLSGKPHGKWLLGDSRGSSVLGPACQLFN